MSMDGRDIYMPLPVLWEYHVCLSGGSLRLSWSHVMLKPNLPYFRCEFARLLEAPNLLYNVAIDGTKEII